MSDVRTYNPEKVITTLGSHVVSGVADDSFITIEPAGDGTTMKVGCDGSVNRSISPNHSFTIKLVTQQSSPTNQFLQNQLDMDQQDGTGTFPILIKDLMGEEQFSADTAWVTKPASWVRGKETNNREWELACGYGKFA